MLGDRVQNSRVFHLTPLLPSPGSLPLKYFPPYIQEVEASLPFLVFFLSLRSIFYKFMTHTGLKYIKLFKSQQRNCVGKINVVIDLHSGV